MNLIYGHTAEIPKESTLRSPGAAQLLSFFQKGDWEKVSILRPASDALSNAIFQSI